MRKSTRNPEELEREITELRQAYEALESRLHDKSAHLDLANKQMLQLAAIVESSEDAIIGCTLGGIITIWNRGAERLFGYSAEEIIGRGATTGARLACPEELKALARVRLGEYVPPFETVRTRKDGKEIHVSVSLSPIRSREGHIVGASAISRDISERKALEDQVRQSQKMEAVGLLAGGVAHDFNNILLIILSCSDLLLGNAHLDDQTKGVVKEIGKAGERAASLIRQLMAFSRRQVLAAKVLDLNAIISDVEKMLRRMIGPDILFTTILAPGLGRVKADPGQVEQVIMNLAVNARDAMSQGGNLTIETINVDLDETYVRTRMHVKPGRYVLMAVSDTGCGMDEQTKARIFEPFFTTKGQGKGTGLGLATVYGIVKQSGGSIDVASEPGRGTTFKIYLPLTEESGHTDNTVAERTETAFQKRPFTPAALASTVHEVLDP
jgi:two-component system, cell cycle sensor histidine kinase and response regulator CckA